ncbi:MAG: hypothetical protein WAV28_09665 [Sedimentisphaerales bacterium]
MKRILLVVLVVCLLAGQASADMYTMDVATAIQLRDISTSWSDTTGGGYNYLKWVGYNPGTSADRVYGSGAYGETMFYAVGFAADLTDLDDDGVASVKIGVAGGAGSLPTGTYDGFYLPISNDNDDNYKYKLYVDDATTGYYESASWTSLSADTQTTLILDLTQPGDGGLDFSNLNDIGFIVQIYGMAGVSDTFHTSIVPVPGAVILGILGLGVVGWKLRKYA